MPTTEQLRSRLLKKLKELFQLNQPDLDFGFYRVMHAKAEQVSEFIEKDLLKIVEDAFGQVDAERKAAYKAEYEKALETARDYGAPDPDNTPLVKEAKAKYLTAAEGAAGEADIYDHLYRFFERYYDNGDFISRRYSARETEGRAAPFAIPYNGEEVKLHWANADQYYIKTSEYFTNFTFDLSKAAQAQSEKNRKERPKGEDLFGETTPQGLTVHFRIVEATEGEHGNVKASEATKRYFIIQKERPVEIDAQGSLTINFEYRPDPEKTGQEGTWRDKKNAEAVGRILEELESGIQKLEGGEGALGIPSPDPAILNRVRTYIRLLKMPAPTDNDAKRPLIAKYVNQYTARNTMDYFIHKDLGAFLRRELDFYIKNEVMYLDDIESAEAPAVESYLAKIKVLRKIAGKLIDFLAQLENFQKKLWLKKKFVVETNYCITLDRIPEELYPEIAANEAQREEWVRLFAIDEIKGDLATVGYSMPLATEFLKANDKLVLDTAFFGEEFKERLMSSIEYFDEQCDGVLVHSENFQALNLLKERYREQVRCVYIDPPYNTDASAIHYKNDYKDSSWAALLSNRVEIARSLQAKDSVFCSAIDDTEFAVLTLLLRQIYGQENALGVVVARSNPSGRSTPKGIAEAHDYAMFFGNTVLSTVGRLPRNEKQISRYSERDKTSAFEWVNFRKHGGIEASRSARRRMYYPIFCNEAGRVRIPEMTWDHMGKSWILLEEPRADETVVWPNNAKNEEKRWKWGCDSVKAKSGDFCARPDQNGDTGVYVKSRMKEEGMLPVTWWGKKEYSATEYGTNLLKDIFGRIADFAYPKALDLVKDCLRVSGLADETLSLDYFSGSGTTGHATISLNREDDGTRKYILVEMGAYFDTVLKPRIAKVVYSVDWKDGKPVSRDSGISHCFKYLRLESYEDTLNNLRFNENPVREKALAGNGSLKEDYMLNYLLDVETRGSDSLLNIDRFSDPTGYTLNVKKPGTDEYVKRRVDLLETFNYLIGLRVVHIAEPQSFVADFVRPKDPELPEDQHTKLAVEGKIKQDRSGPWWFRKVEGWVPKDPQNPNNGQKEKVLIVWRKLTDDLEKDNLMLDEWFEKNRISTRDFEFNTIYVNGSNNLPNLLKEGDTWKVRLIEEEFMKRMWDTGEV